MQSESKRNILGADTIGDMLRGDLGTDKIITRYALDRYKLHHQKAISGEKEDFHEYWKQLVVNDDTFKDWTILETDRIEAFLRTFDGVILRGPLFREIGEGQGMPCTPMIGYLFRRGQDDQFCEIWFANRNDRKTRKHQPFVCPLNVDADIFSFSFGDQHQ